MAEETFSTLKDFTSAVENVFLLSNDPSSTVVAITLRRQQPDESIMAFANALFQLHNEFLMLNKLKNDGVQHEGTASNNEELLTSCFLSNMKQPFATFAKGFSFKTFLEEKKMGS